MKTDYPHTNSLFIEEELQKSDPLMMQAKQSEPVVCLGMTFESDEARRAYFRDELKKKLPELKKIEGFPIGDDEDIINLSDPPYYTACPNPWLNDFIEEWEKEKVQLTAEGKRSDDFEVKEPYASDVSEGKNNPVYRAHPYHTKVPHPAVMRYILHFTQPGDIIFDGFAGTGMTGVAAAACVNGQDDIAKRINVEWQKEFNTVPRWGQRHAICGDLSPYATSISNFYNLPINPSSLTSEVARIKKELEEELGWMYVTLNSKGEPSGKINFFLWSDVMLCSQCGKEYVLWEHGAKMVNNRVTSLESYQCPHCSSLQRRRTSQFAVETYFDKGLNTVKKRVKQVPVIIVGKDRKEKIQRAPSEFDFDLLRKIEEYTINYWYPTVPLPEGLKTKDPKAREVYYSHQFYTTRTLIALSAFYNKIETSKHQIELRFMFTSLLNLVSKRNRVQARNPYSRGQGVLNLTLVLPPFPTEASLFEMLDMRLSSMLKAKEIIPNQRNNALYTSSADDLNIKSDSIDYIFTDPPFGANINYSELNSMPEPWLKVITNNNREAIVNEFQGKSTLTYRETMKNCFCEYFRILKPGKWMTVEFSNTSASVWNSIQNALQQAGFVIANVAALDKKQGGMNANMTTTAVKQDLAISCYKPSERISKLFSRESSTNIWEFVQEHLERLPSYQSRNNKTEFISERDLRILYDRVVSYFVQHNINVPLDAHDFQKGMRERYKEIDGMFFTYEQAAEYLEKKKLAPEMAPLGLIVSDEANGIQWLRNELVKPQTYQDIQPKWMQAIGAVRKNDILPELKQLLEENFIAEADGKWRLPNIQDDADLEALRTKSLLREFKIYVEAAEKPKAKIKEARVEALRAGFKQCYVDKDFETIVMVGNKIPQNLRDEDEVLLQFYDIALNKI